MDAKGWNRGEVEGSAPQEPLSQPLVKTVALEGALSWRVNALRYYRLVVNPDFSFLRSNVKTNGILYLK